MEGFFFIFLFCLHSHWTVASGETWFMEKSYCLLLKVVERVVRRWDWKARQAGRQGGREGGRERRREGGKGEREGG